MYTITVVIPLASINGSLSVGNILVGNNSDGFLETVSEIIQEKEGKFVYTELSVCHRNFSRYRG